MANSDNLNDKPAGQPRRPVRVPFVVEVSSASSHEFWTGFTSNLSAGGVFVATPAPVALGTIVQFEMRLPGNGATYPVKGEVRWQRAEDASNPNSPPGIGIRFIDLDPALQTRIEEFVNSQRDTMFYDDDV